MVRPLEGEAARVNWYTGTLVYGYTSALRVNSQTELKRKRVARPMKEDAAND
jgi:hypothetical protein